MRVKIEMVVEVQPKNISMTDEPVLAGPADAIDVGLYVLDRLQRDDYLKVCSLVPTKVD
jgi:hypothetical protein